MDYPIAHIQHSIQRYPKLVESATLSWAAGEVESGISYVPGVFARTMGTSCLTLVGDLFRAVESGQRLKELRSRVGRIIASRRMGVNEVWHRAA